jgi:hypothetical protein
MRIDLKSLMTLAHSLKTRYMLTLREALKLAWLKAKGFAYVAEVSVVDAAYRVAHVYLPALDYDTARAARIAFTREIAVARSTGDYSRNVHSSLEIRL